MGRKGGEGGGSFGHSGGRSPDPGLFFSEATHRDREIETEKRAVEMNLLSSGGGGRSCCYHHITPSPPASTTQRPQREREREEEEEAAATVAPLPGGKKAERLLVSQG